MIERLARRFDRQFGYARFIRKEMVEKIFPDHWTFLFGEIALYSFIILVMTGTFLIFFFRPSEVEVTYNGAYTPLVGVPMSQAYRSMLDLSFSVRGGLLMRQMHHWACDLFVAAIVIHMLRLFFTGAYRFPREENWRAGLTLLILAMLNGFSGYSIGDDMLSGAGLRIGYAIALSIPLIGPYIAFMFLGGPPPNMALTPRLYALHIFLVPLLIVAVLAVHLGILWRQKHTNYPGPKRSNTTIVGSRLWPVYATKSIALFFFVFGILAGLGAFVEINPIWLYGPYFGPGVSAGSQPDWYLGWLEGALRLLPSWSGYIWENLVAQPFLAAVVFPAFLFGFLYLWPSIAPKEGAGGDLNLIQRMLLADHPFLEIIGLDSTQKDTVHHVLHLPRDHPWLTMLGVGIFTLTFVTLLGGADDIISVIFNTDVSMMRNIFRGLVFGLPVLVAAATYFFLMLWGKTHPRAESSAEGETEEQ